MVALHRMIVITRISLCPDFLAFILLWKPWSVGAFDTNLNDHVLLLNEPLIELH